MKVNLVSKKQDRKKDAFVVYNSACVKMILTLLREIIILYVSAFIVKIGVLGFKKVIMECGICLKLAIFLALNK